MVRRLLTGIATVLVFSAAAPLQAESIYEHAVRVNIPFVFSAGSKPLPAGEYIVTVDSSNGQVKFEHDGETAVALTTIPKETIDIPTRGRLVFEMNGSTFYLTEVWTPANPVGHTLIYKSDAPHKGTKSHLQIEAH